MAVELRRGCGYRKAGGLYVRGDLSGAIPAEFLPFCIDYPFSRGMTWAQSERLFTTCGDEKAGGYRQFGRLGLLWIGEQHYKTPADFSKEAIEQGVSRRVAFLPKDMKPGDPIAAAHLRAVRTWKPESGEISVHCPDCWYVPQAKVLANTFRTIARNTWPTCTDDFDLSIGRNEKVEGIAGVFTLFRMTALEVVLPESVARDPDIQRRCEEHDVLIVTVPDGDKDHVPAGWKLPRFLLDDEQGKSELVDETGECDACGATTGPHAPGCFPDALRDLRKVLKVALNG